MATATAAVITGIDVHCYLVKDPKRAIKFYRDVVGLPLTRELGGNGAEFELADGSTFGLWRMDDGSWFESHGVMFAVDDIRRALASYRKRGGSVLGDLIDNDHCLMAICQDSEGNGFILHQFKRQNAA
ncbi:MAG TPA: VOC family protein [Candidatus Eremiobacteraceae bacterium]|nr:VOC family protein [Candidatus Eremiobacteraceae bacterium]